MKKELKKTRLDKVFFYVILLFAFINVKGQADQNILVDFPDFDPTFETGLTTGLWGGSTVVSNNAYSGSNAARLDDNSEWGGGLELLITELSPSTTYKFSAYVRLSSGSGNGSLVAKDYGAEGLQVEFSNTAYEQKSVTFTTGLTETSATIAIYNPAGGTAVIYADDLSLLDMGPGDPSTLEPLDSTDYLLVWNDEFNTDGAIDTTKWQCERGFKRNNEEQYYLPENLIQQDGNLVISAIREQYANENYDATSTDWRENREYANWTSGSINTSGNFDFLYGRIECRAKVTNLTGTWPAIWTVGQEVGEQTFADPDLLGGCSTGEWPAGGEVDIMENYGGGILGNFAWAGSGRWNARWDSRWMSVDDFGDPDWADKYHIWTLDWTSDIMRIYIDGIFINEFDPNTSNNNNSYACPGTAPFKSSPQMLWLNLALGGNAGGSTANLPDSTIYLVDYIRVYQLGSAGNLIDDPGFETGASNFLWGGSSVVTNNVYAGSYAVRLEDNSQWGGGYEASISGLEENTTYTFSAYVRSSGGEGRIGVKEHGDSESYTAFTNTSYEQQSITFTTGENNTSATVFIYNPVGGAETLYADDLVLERETPPTNLIEDPGFETGASDYVWGGSNVVTNNVYAGSYAARLEDNSEWGGGYEATISGLEENTSYTFSAYVRSSGGEGRIGVKEHGNSSSYTAFTNTSFEQQSITFTTGESNSSATVYIFNPVGGAATLYADDLELSLSSELKSSKLTLEREEKILPEVSIFPNPASEQLNVTFSDQGEHAYSIVTLNGKVVKSGLISSGSVIELSDLQSGFYLFRISSLDTLKKLFVE